MVTQLPDPICIGCGRKPHQIQEYVDLAAEIQAEADDEGPERPNAPFHRTMVDIDDVVRSEEGTYNPRNGHFTCTDCYVRMGMPTTPAGWKAP